MGFRLIPRDTVFFELFEAAGANIVTAADVLARLMTPDARPEEIAARMREIEHEGDSITHRILRPLNSSFVTPFDREDIYRLAGTLDDVVDSMDAAADMVVLTGLSSLPQLMGQQIELLQEAGRATAVAMPNLRTMKDLEPYWIEVNRLENEADRAYRKLLSRLYSGEFDALTMLKLKAVADNLEDAADALEHVAHAVETIAVKES
ncbi:MAG: putative phosphate transport regulator [Jatrophihabitantaceae bacterium]|nr:putative phosphate transport regulator [Jatrophihabitantaceae bacterium]